MFVKVTETYDLSTKIGKMGLVGIHTPEGRLVHKLWSGLYQNFSKIRFDHCDVALACASMLPADPLQIGVEAGSIAPQDMFNPILYKPVSNDSMSQLLNRLYLGSMASTVELAKNSVIDSNNGTYGTAGASTRSSDGAQIPTSTPSQFDIYYALLSDSDGWRKAMPQAGLEMTGLYPLVWSILKTSGQPSNWSSSIQQEMLAPGNTNYASNQLTDSVPLVGSLGQYMRGPAQRMPSCDTYVVSKIPFSQSPEVRYDKVPRIRNNDLSHPDFASSGAQYDTVVPVDSSVLPNLDMPDCFVAAIVLPPATLNQLYYRMKVTWSIEFTDPRPLTDLTNWFGLQAVGQQSYGTDYVAQTQALKSSGESASLGMLDTSEVDVKKIMEGSK